MAGLGRGHVYDPWHPTKKYLPKNNDEIKLGLSEIEEQNQIDLEIYRYIMSKECSPENDKWRKLELQWADYD